MVVIGKPGLQWGIPRAESYKTFRILVEGEGEGYRYRVQTGQIPDRIDRAEPDTALPANRQRPASRSDSRQRHAVPSYRFTNNVACFVIPPLEAEIVTLVLVLTLFD